jgi:hypothetical protein
MFSTGILGCIGKVVVVGYRIAFPVRPHNFGYLLLKLLPVPLYRWIDDITSQTFAGGFVCAMD